MEGYSIPQLIKNQRKRMKEKDGIWTIEFVIAVLITLMVLCALLDILILSWRFAVISQTTNHLARTIALQGGVERSVPQGYPGGDDVYLTTSELEDDVARMLEYSDIELEDYNIKINGVPFGQNVRVDYRGDIIVEMEVKYEWAFLSNFIPGNLSHSVHSKRATISEYKYHYEDWIGE